MLLRVWLPLAAFRLLSVVLVSSWFVPDEVYQSSEVAHRVVFSTGHLSWEWTHALRSVLHPTLIAVLYQLLALLGLDSSQSIIALAPRVLHALIFSLGDLAYFRLADRVSLTSDSAYFAKTSYLSCWFIFYCAGRTLSNSLETALTLIALLWYPFEGPLYNGPVFPYMAIGLLTIIIRPTAALIWLVLGVEHLRRSPEPVKLILRTAIPTMIPVLAGAVLLDSIVFKRFTFSAWNFLMFNVFEGGSAHFGVHPWHWFFSQGLPSVLTVQMVPILFGLMSPLRPQLLLFSTSAFYILFHSILPHKEQRFLLPIIPFLCIYAGSFFADRRQWKIRRVVYYLMFIINLVLALYTGLRHQVGPYSAADAVINRSAGQNSSVLVLMPCYSLPGHSYFHNEISVLRQLDCSPDLENIGGVDEADAFHEDPSAWMEKNPLSNFTNIVLYEKMYFRIAEKLTSLGFAVCDRVFHADILTSSRQDHYILVLCKS